MNKEHWIFLRGLTRGNIHWLDFEKTFKANFPNAEVEFLEIPGNGERFREKTPIDPHFLIKNLRQHSKFIQDGEKIHICGISLGGIIALKWAELFSQDILSIHIINSSLGQYSPIKERLIPKSYLSLLEIFLLNDPLKEESLILDLTSNISTEKKMHAAKFAEFSKSHPPSKLNFLRQLILAKNIYIESLPLVPFQVIASKNDRLVNFSCSEKIALKLGGKMHIHQTAGHDLPLDAPMWLSETLGKYTSKDLSL